MKKKYSLAYRYFMKKKYPLKYENSIALEDYRYVTKKNSKYLITLEDYPLNKDEEKDYIKKIEVEEMGNLTATTAVFASGKILNRIPNNIPDRNSWIREGGSRQLEKQHYTLYKQLSNQSVEAMKKYDKFVFEKNKAKLILLSEVSAGIIASVLCATPLVQNAIGIDPVVAAASIGTITILGSIPLKTRLVKVSKKVQELHLIRFLIKSSAECVSCDERNMAEEEKLKEERKRNMRDYEIKKFNEEFTRLYLERKQRQPDNIYKNVYKLKRY